MNRREWLTRTGQAGAFAALGFAGANAFAAKEPPNVLFLAVDDWCDWTGPMRRGQALTPNLDKLAKRGVTFTNAHCPGVFCAPSRSAIFSGRHATTTGVYSAQVPFFYDHPEYRPLQLAFSQAGYDTYGAGKLYHHPAGYIDQRGWSEFFLRTDAQRKTGWGMDSWEHGAPLPDPYPYSKFNDFQIGKEKVKPFMEVAPLPNDVEEEMADTIRANWAVDVINRKHDKPFFLALGLYAPHFPNYAPQKYFDLYKLDKIEEPICKDDDLEDLPPKIRKQKEARRIAIHDKLHKLGIVKETLQGYLACISYADAMLGRALDALEASPHADNTVVVLWSDNGYHHGEKGHWGKHTLWQRTSNVPFMWSGPGMPGGSRVETTASLVDIYPTLVEMCDLKREDGLDGESLASTLRNPDKAKDRNVLQPYDVPDSYAVINARWRYIHYEDGTEEFYDVVNDFPEWHNLASKPEHRGQMDRMKAWAPQKQVPGATAKGRLNMICEGDTFRYEPKQPAGKGKKK